MRKLENKPFIEAPSVNYPYGRIKDKTGVNRGTPVNEEVYGDQHQFFEKLMNEAGIIGNDLPENVTNGFQLIEALKAFGVNNFSTDLLYSLIDSYTANDVIILHGCNIMANIPGTSTITAGAIYYNGNIYKVLAQSISTPADTIVFKIDTTQQPNLAFIENNTTGSGIIDYTDVKTIKCNIYLNDTNFYNYFNFTPGTGVTSIIIQRANIIKIFNKIKMQVFGVLNGPSQIDKKFALDTTVNNDFKMLNSGGADLEGLYRIVGNNGFNSPIVIGQSISIVSKGIVQADSFTSTNQINVSNRYDVPVINQDFTFECEYIGANAFFKPYQF